MNNLELEGKIKCLLKYIENPLNLTKYELESMGWEDSITYKETIDALRIRQDLIEYYTRIEQEKQTKQPILFNE